MRPKAARLAPRPGPKPRPKPGPSPKPEPKPRPKLLIPEGPCATGSVHPLPSSSTPRGLPCCSSPAACVQGDVDLPPQARDWRTAVLQDTRLKNHRYFSGEPPFSHARALEKCNSLYKFCTPGRNGPLLLARRPPCPKPAEKSRSPTPLSHYLAKKD